MGLKIMGRNRGSIMAIVLGGVLLSTFFQNCDPMHNKGNMDPSDSSSSLGPLQAEALSVLNQRCIECHNPTQADSAEPADLNNVAQLIEDGHIIAGEPQNSPLYLDLYGIKPKPDDLLSETEIDAIRLWIAALGGNMNLVIGIDPIIDDDDGSGPATYADVANLIQRRCLGCHNANPARANLANYQGVRAQVTPGNSAASRLSQVVNSNQMPPNNPLPIEERAILNSWINSGAPNN